MGTNAGKVKLAGSFISKITDFISFAILVAVNAHQAIQKLSTI
jgi:hypothetical protein